MLDITLIILRWKRVLQIVLPVAFTLDAAHNAYIMYKLYEGRLKVQTRQSFRANI